MHIESLEDRRLLSITVNSDLDTVNANDGVTTLREAIHAANSAANPDVIEFDFGHDEPVTIQLTNSQFDITAPLTINGLAANLVTIDAQHLSRIFDIAQTSGDVIIRGLSLTNGQTTGAGVHYSDLTYAGGAIRSFTPGKLTIDGCTLSYNRTVGDYAGGGAILSVGELEITSSRVTESSADGLASYGGAIRSYGPLTLIDSTVSGNRTSNEYASGGAIYAPGTVQIYNCVISGNRSADSGGAIYTVRDMEIWNSTISDNISEGNGGGICSDANVWIYESVVSGNSAKGKGGGVYASNSVFLDHSAVTNNQSRGAGGGIHAHEAATLTFCLVQGNSTSNAYAAGGGIWADRPTITSTTISGNSTAGDYADGGGIAGGRMTISNSTISGNSTYGVGSDGGGIWVYATSTIAHTTITENQALGPNASGGGIWAHSDVPSLPPRNLTISGSIIAVNSAGNGNPDIRPGSTLIVRYSLIGDKSGTNLTETPLGSTDLMGNRIGGPIYGSIDPLLGPLADNGAPTQTHAILGGSPAIDAGDPAAVAGIGSVPLRDQRGAPYTRVYNGDGIGGARIDIGAFEWQPIPAVSVGDYNGDGAVDAADHIVWRMSFGDSVTPFTGADGSGNGIVDQADRAVWFAHFGQTLLPTGVVALGKPSADVGEIESVAVRNDLVPTATADAASLPPALPGILRETHREAAVIDLIPAPTTKSDAAVRSEIRSMSINSRAVVSSDAALMAWLAEYSNGDRRQDDAAIVPTIGHDADLNAAKRAALDVNLAFEHFEDGTLDDYR